MKYTYRARTKEGKIETGTIEAYSKETAALLLQKYNVFVTSLQEQEDESPWFKFVVERSVNKKDITIFFRQLSVMLQSRVPVVQSLQSLASQTAKNKFKEVINKVSTLVEEGIPLSEALNTYPNIFDNFYISLVRSGEASGNISGALDYISVHLEREGDIVSQLRQAMVYPIFVMGVLVIVIGIIIVAVIPRVVDLIKESGSKPPLFTRITLSFYEFLQHWWWALAVGLLLLVLAIIFYLRTNEGKEGYDKIALKIPFLGEMLKKVFLARFCGNIATLITAGISINRALEITGEAVNNVVYKEIIHEIGRGVSEGEKMSSVMAKHHSYFPPFVIQMIKVGEETGKLDKTLVEVVNFYQKEVKRSVDLFTSLIEPVMIIFLGIIVAALAISVLAPLYGALGTI